MIRQCFLANTGIQFYRETFKDIGLDPETLYPFVPRPKALKADASIVAKVKMATNHKAEPTDLTLFEEVQASPTAASSFKTEEEEELEDALCPLFDQLKLSKTWWILEILPTRHRKQNRHDASWVSYWTYVFFTLGFRGFPLRCHSRGVCETGSIRVARVKFQSWSVRRRKRSMCIALSRSGWKLKV